MKFEEAIAYLKENGYEHETSTAKGFTTVLMWRRLEGASYCKRNNQSPSICFRLYEHPLGTSMGVNIRAEALNREWVNVGYYGLSIEEVKNFKEYESMLSKMWECAN